MSRETIESVAEQIIDALDCDVRLRPPTDHVIAALRIDLAKNGNLLPTDEEIDDLVMGEQGSPEMTAVQAKYPETDAYIGSLF